MTDPTRRPNPNAGKQPQRPQPAAPRPAPAPAKPAAGARPAPAGARPAPAPARPAAAPAPRPRAPAPVEVEEPAPARRAPQRRAAPGDEPLDSTTKKGLIAAAVLLIGALVIVVVISNKKKAEDEAVKAVQTMVANFEKDIDAVVKNDNATEAEIEGAIKRIDTEMDKWKDRSTETTIQSDRSRLVGKLEEKKRREEFRQRFGAAKDAVDNAATKSSDDLIKTRQVLTEISQGSDQYDPANPDKIKKMVESIDQTLVGKMRDEAKAFVAASSTTPRQGLAKYAAAEDYVRKAIEDAKKSNRKEDDAKYTDIYKGLLQESDEYSQKVINSEFIESIPWKDLLNGEMATKWSKVTNVPGFSSRVDDGRLTVSPPEAGSKLQGIVGILDQPNDNLRHLALDMEFTVDSGVAQMFFHVSPPPGSPNAQQSEAYDLKAADGYLKPGARYNMVASFIGSDLVIRITGNDDNIPEYRPNPSWAKRRRGGIAFLIPEGCRLKVTKMRIKELR